MLIPLSIGSFRIACLATRAELEAELAEDLRELSDKSFQQLRDGAVHNGLNPTQAQLDEMKEMSARDVQHITEGHPSQQILGHIKTMLAMADYVDQSDSYAEVVIDSTEFQLLQDHLPLEKKKD